VSAATRHFALLFAALLLALRAGEAQTGRQAASGKRYTTWSDYGGSADSAQYSALDRINRSNVGALQVAWTYPTGDGNTYLFDPVAVDDVLYVLAKNNSIVALDAATGKQRWAHETAKGPITTRGINYWESRDRSDRRLLYSSNHLLHAIDAVTGEPIGSFGVNGRVDLRDAINRGVLLGPRMQVVGQSLNQRAARPYPSFFERFQDRFTESKNPNSPWLARAAVREAKLHGVDWVKIYTTQDFVGDSLDEFRPDGSLVASPSLTLEEVFNDHIKPLKVPAWQGAMIGHRMPQFTIAVGGQVEIDATTGRIRMLEPAVN